MVNVQIRETQNRCMERRSSLALFGASLWHQHQQQEQRSSSGVKMPSRRCLYRRAWNSPVALHRRMVAVLFLLFIVVMSLSKTSCRAQLNARADFHMNGVGGNILFSWNPQSHQMTINTMGLKGLSPQLLTSGLTWHVHEFPFKLNSPDPCSASSTGGHFDPLGRASAPNYAQICQSQMSMRFRDCELGDLSGKFGTLQLREYVELTPNLSLSGNFGFVGRSVVIHRNGARWVCANIEPVLQHTATCAQAEGSNKRRLLVAKFKWPIAGEVFFRQVDTRDPAVRPTPPIPAGQPVHTSVVNISTVVHSHLYWLDQTAAMSPAQSATSFLPPSQMAGNSFLPAPNQPAAALPMGIRTFQAGPGASPGYMWQVEAHPVLEKAQFSPNPQSRCSGTGATLVHLTSMLGPVSVGIDPNSASTSKSLYTTNNSMFYPIDNFIRRSLVLLDPTRRRIACATIHEVQPATALATLPHDMGTVELSQSSEFDNTEVKANFNKLFNVASDYGIRTLSMKQSNGRENACNERQTGPMFNPLRTQSPPTKRGSPNLYQIGDLSGKFGELRNRFSYRRRFCDPNLPMFGTNSVVGRSLVIDHQTTGNAPIACARLDRTPQHNSRLLKAKATFTSPVRGTILLEQEQFADGQLGNTHITSYGLRNFNSWQTDGHMYHIHINRIGILSTQSEMCSNAHAGPHYNPFNASVDATYPKQCSPQNPYRCELGDTSKKTGKIAVRNVPQYHIDPDLPLTGPHSALGRSMVIHNPNGAAARLACGNVIPEDSHDVVMTVLVSPLQFKAQHFKQRMAGAMRISAQDVLYLKSSPLGPCTAVSFALRHPQAEQLASTILLTDLGPYTHDVRCADPSQLVAATPRNGQRDRNDDDDDD
eukprot:scpid33674/ scgid15033/ 